MSEYPCLELFLNADGQVRYGDRHWLPAVSETGLLSSSEPPLMSWQAKGLQGSQQRAEVQACSRSSLTWSEN